MDIFDNKSFWCQVQEQIDAKKKKKRLSQEKLSLGNTSFRHIYIIPTPLLSQHLMCHKIYVGLM